MKSVFRALAFCATLSVCGVLVAHDLVVPKNENESYGYTDSPKQPWSEFRVHDPGRPIPKKLNPTPPTYFQPAPNDAIVLFDGKNIDAWEPTKWKRTTAPFSCICG